MALAAEGVKLTLAARGAEQLEKTAAEAREKHGVEVRALAVDVTSEAGRDAILEACPEPDILVNNAGGPPPGDFRTWTRDDWLQALNANMYSAFDLIRRCVDGMAERGFGRIVNITSVSVKAPIPELGLSNGARAALTGWVSGAARQFAHRNVTINNLLPGIFDTDRGNAVLDGRAAAQGISREALDRRFLPTIPARRLGAEEEFGAACAFLCSSQAAYITAQNLLLDGGAYPGVF
jgi:3-oxoacyl-[acyl-carrier protein] reductase